MVCGTGRVKTKGKLGGKETCILGYWGVKGMAKSNDIANVRSYDKSLNWAQRHKKAKNKDLAFDELTWDFSLRFQLLLLSCFLHGSLTLPKLVTTSHVA
jgi:hypothetical protein